MTSLTALPSLPSPPVPGVTAAIPDSGMVEMADFSQILALQGESTAAPAPKGAQPCIMPADPGLTAKPVPSGKILPPDLPPLPGVTVLPPMPRLKALPGLGEETSPGTEPAEAGALAEPDALAAPTATFAAEPQPAPLALAIALAVDATPAAAATQSDGLPAEAVPAPAPRTGSALSQRAAATGSSLQQPVAQADGRRALPDVALAPGAAQPAAPIVAELQVRAARPAAGADQLPDAPLAERPGEALLLVPVHNPVTAVQPAAQPSASATDPAPRPLDFAALVDRLAAAREAVQPHTVSVALDHGDFGAIRLHFRHENGGLAVALASSDPAFARAVTAAPLSPPAADPAASSPGQFASQPHGGSQGGSQGRADGSAAERREERTPRGNPAQRSAERGGQPAHRGLFA